MTEIDEQGWGGNRLPQAPGEPMNVNIASESGVRIVERQLMTTHERIAAWPEDRPSQRAWALSVVVQISNGFLKKDMTTEELFEEAQKIVEWIQGRD